jgi:transposase
MQIHSVGIDLGKTTFHLVALGAAGKVLARKKFTQRQLLTFTANMQTSLIGLEACAGAHFLGRALRKQGHDVRLIPAQFVKPFVKSNKNDFIDAEAIAEAVERKNMRFVPIKTDDQLDLQAIHRVRDRLISRRTAVINQLRAFLLERGMVFAKTPAKLRASMSDILENADADLTPQMRNLIHMLWSEWKTVEQQVEELTEELERISASDAGCTRIRQIPGIGPVVATAIVAAIGNGAAFRKGREFAAWLGIVPRQYSTGGKARLLSLEHRTSDSLPDLFVIRPKRGSGSDKLAINRQCTQRRAFWMNYRQYGSNPRAASPRWESRAPLPDIRQPRTEELRALGDQKPIDPSFSG